MRKHERQCFQVCWWLLNTSKLQLINALPTLLTLNQWEPEEWCSTVDRQSIHPSSVDHRVPADVPLLSLAVDVGSVADSDLVAPGPGAFTWLGIWEHWQLDRCGRRGHQSKSKIAPETWWFPTRCETQSKMLRISSIDSESKQWFLGGFGVVNSWSL